MRKLVGLWCLLAASGALAQRDPMQPPPEARMAAPNNGADGAANALPWGEDGATIVVREGRPHLVVGTRIYGPGQPLGKYLIERITETEVVLREGKKAPIRVPVYTGIERRAAKPTPP